MRGEPVTLADEAKSRVKQSRQVVEDILASERVVYGINTGFGNFRNVVIPRHDSHAAGVGAPFPEEIVRAILLLRVNALASGFSGVVPSTLDALVAMLNKRVHPVVPTKGSVGASGDSLLSPMSRLS